MTLRFITDLLVFLSSTVKFALGSSVVVTGNMGISGTVSNILGGITGILLFTYLGGYMRIWLIQKFPNQNRRFSRGSRLLVRLKRHGGLTGIAFLTPIFLSIPVGVLLALDIHAQKTKIVTSMVFSCIFWSAVFFVPYFAFNINVIGWFKTVF